MRHHVSISILFLGLFLAALVCAPAAADSIDGHATLRESHDPSLQDLLSGSIDALGLRRAVRRKELAVALVDLGDSDRPRVADLNGDEMMYAASLPKIAILLAAFVEIERGSLILDAATRKSMTDMIRYSSNVEATRMLNRIGKRRVNEILQSERFRLYDPLVNGGLWVGKEYARGTAYARDPLHNLSHGATALQTARFYYLLETGQLVNPALTREMKSMLSRPGVLHKFVKALAGKHLNLYRKSGTWRQWHADSVLVEGKDTRYILVGLAANPSGGKWLTRIAENIHTRMSPTKLAAASTSARR